ncbi:MAG: hypothetical protein N3E37_00755 [Candidatus Micrarchaeota archaeon]|nr:hypothetical protein [Candidatus Micrarchaeota archaeon]
MPVLQQVSTGQIINQQEKNQQKNNMQNIHEVVPRVAAQAFNQNLGNLIDNSSKQRLISALTTIANSVENRNV